MGARLLRTTFWISRKSDFGRLENRREKGVGVERGIEELKEMENRKGKQVQAIATLNVGGGSPSAGGILQGPALVQGHHALRCHGFSLKVEIDHTWNTLGEQTVKNIFN
jgi:hypothetical protein